MQRPLKAAIGPFLAFWIALAVDATSAQTIDWTFQARSVSASVAGGNSQSFSAPDFGPFIASASAFGGIGAAYASQASYLNPTNLVNNSYAQGSSTGGATSALRVRFTISELVAFTIAGNLQTSGGFASVGLVSVPGGKAIFSAGVQWSGEAPLDAAGLLAPGEYELGSSASSSGLPGGNATCNYRFQIPEPAGVQFVLAALCVTRRPRRRRAPATIEFGAAVEPVMQQSEMELAIRTRSP